MMKAVGGIAEKVESGVLFASRSHTILRSLLVTGDSSILRDTEALWFSCVSWICASLWDQEYAAVSAVC